MLRLHLETALLPDGWQDQVRLTADAGQIVSIDVGQPAQPGDERYTAAVPGMANLHSHAFQRAMAGLTEVRGGSMDNFWSWRELMYRFALTLGPDDIETIACQLYVEMLESGFTRVGEFHYLHHDIDGRPYAAIGEMAERIAAAAEQTGIALTLLPVFYAHANFGGSKPKDAQRRFINDTDRFARLLEASRQAVARIPGAIVGVAPHSLRSVIPQELEFVSEISMAGPIHIHVAEQTQEVTDCLTWSGARPVDWLLEHAAIDSRWCLIHATHTTPAEIDRIAASGAIVGLCPITEANLGDGIFDGKHYKDAGGSFGIGTDSNVAIGAAEELCQLEYSQRLLHRQRNVMATGNNSTGRILFDMALAGGAQALGAPDAGLKIGASADIVTLDTANPLMAHLERDRLLDGWVFHAGRAMIDSVWVRGCKLVAGGRHLARDAVARRYQRVMASLLERVA